MFRGAALIFALVIIVVPGFAEDSLGRLLRENSYVLSLEHGTLSGPGIESLLSEVEDAQFLCLAEPHNSHEIPRFVTALFKRLQDDRSFHCLAIEQGPPITRRIAEMAQSSTNAEIRKSMKRHKKALHFKTAEEVEMIADVARISTGSVHGLRVGLGRVLGDSYTLDEIVAQTPLR